MAFVAMLHSRLKARPDSEHEQAALRVMTFGLTLGYFSLAHAWRNRWSARDVDVVWALGGFLLLAVALLVAICVHPDRDVPRRLVGMVADVAAVTWYMAIAGEFGFFAIGLYLFITLGNGFRYGRSYLFVCQCLCIAGMAAVLLFSPYWQSWRVAGGGLLTSLVVLPLYISVLLRGVRSGHS